MEPFFGGDLEPILKGSFIGGSGSGVDNPDVNARRAPIPAPRNRSGGCLARAVRPPVRPAVLPPVLKAMLIAMLSTGLALPAAWASDQRDHERARAAVQAGEVLPLPTLLERLRRTHPGRVLELELEREHGRWIYEVRMLQANGQLLKLELDAGTGQVLQVKRRKERP
jgi:hypothetical protein